MSDYLALERGKRQLRYIYKHTYMSYTFTKLICQFVSTDLHNSSLKNPFVLTHSSTNLSLNSVTESGFTKNKLIWFYIINIRKIEYCVKCTEPF